MSIVAVLCVVRVIFVHSGTIDGTGLSAILAIQAADPVTAVTFGLSIGYLIGRIIGHVIH